MFGPINETNTKMADLNARELAYFAPLLVAAFWIGLYPKPLLAVLEKPVAKLVTQVNPGFYKQEALEAAQRKAAKRGMAAMAAPEAKPSPIEASQGGGR